MSYQETTVRGSDRVEAMEEIERDKMTIWNTAVERVLRPVARSLVAVSRRLMRKETRKELTVPEIAEALREGRLHLDDVINTSGTFSEYVPFVDFATLIKPDLNSSAIGTCRLGDLIRNNSYIGALFAPEARNSKDPAIPIIYSSEDKSRKIFSFSTGDQVELECRLIPLDYEFRKIIEKRDYFCFEEKPFGLEILDVYTKKRERAEKFEIGGFILTSMKYEGGTGNLFSSLREIYDRLEYVFEVPPFSSVLVSLQELTRDGFLVGKILDQNDRPFANINWIEKKLIRFSWPINVIDVKTSKEAARNIKDLITHFSFIDADSEEDVSAINSILKGLDVASMRRDYKKLEPKDRRLLHCVEEIRSQPSLVKAWDSFLEPKLNVDFQFDQVCPIVKQAIDPRALLKQRGLV